MIIRPKLKKMSADPFDQVRTETQQALNEIRENYQKWWFADPSQQVMLRKFIVNMILTVEWDLHDLNSAQSIVEKNRVNFVIGDNELEERRKFIRDSTEFLNSIKNDVEFNFNEGIPHTNNEYQEDNNIPENPAQKIVVTRKETNGVEYLQCEACENYFEEVRCRKDNLPLIVGGCHISVSSGDYSGFNDESGGEDFKAMLCHDCTLKVYRMISKFKNAAIHPVECCVGELYSSGEKLKREYLELFQRVFPEEFPDDSFEMDWPMFEHSLNGRNIGGCEWS